MSLLLHSRARGPHPAYPKRATVSDARVSWTKSYPQYKPVEFVHEAVADNMKSPRPWADLKNVDNNVLSNRFTLVGSVRKRSRASDRSALRAFCIRARIARAIRSAARA